MLLCRVVESGPSLLWLDNVCVIFVDDPCDHFDDGTAIGQVSHLINIDVAAVLVLHLKLLVQVVLHAGVRNELG